MPDYSKCCVYKLCCKDATIESIYIGSTTNITKRKSDHKTRCSNPNDSAYNQYKYEFIRDHGGWQNWDLIVLEQFSCHSKMEQHKIERDYVEKLKPTLNRNIPANYQTGDVYNKKEYDQRYKKERYEVIRDKVIEKQKQYYETNKEQAKAYYKNNKDKLCKPYTCECGRTIQHTVKARHFRSKVHQDYISSISSSSSSSSSSNEEA